MDPKAADRLNLAGRRALITGGARGIGRAIALLYAARGADIVVLDIDADALDALSADFTGDGTILTYACDATAETDIHAAFVEIRAKLGPLDILVNNVGIGARVPTTELDIETWSRVMDVNLTGTFVCSREFALQADPGRGGAIVE